MDLDWIARQQPRMEQLLEEWVNINSFTDSPAGVKKMADALEMAFSSLEVPIKRIPLAPRTVINSDGQILVKPLGEALHMVTPGPFRLFLGGHLDTVFPPDSPFQKAKRLNKEQMQGPGTADMKGGLVILLILLEALKRSSPTVGWELLINPDEEIGSIGSRGLLESCAKRNQVGLIFEPSFPDGSIASSRKGSANFTLVAKGKSGHAGRDFAQGRNAITALAQFILKAETLTDLSRETTLNVGVMKGGLVGNIIPDLATCVINVRIAYPEELEKIRSHLKEFAAEVSQQREVSIEIHEDSASPPKPFDAKQLALFEQLQECGRQLGQTIRWQPSGGTCDGNRLYAAGLPSIDALGVIGGNLHTHEEYVVLPSLSQRAQLAALLVERLSS